MCVQSEGRREKCDFLKFHCANSVLLDHSDLGERFCHCATVASQVSNAGFQSAHIVTKKIRWSEVKHSLQKNNLAICGYNYKKILEAITVPMTYARPQDKPQFLFRSHASLFWGRDVALNSLQHLLEVCEHHMASTRHLQTSLLTSG